jgi:predicted  nucleic acid-binding Zn-ribbon protein
LDRTNAERQRRYIQRLKARAAGVTNASDTAGEIAALKQELTQAKARIAELEAARPTERDGKDPRVAELQRELQQAKARITEMGLERAAERQAFRDEWERRAAKAKPKAEKPPLPPDEARDRQIKSLKTRVRTLMSELHDVREHAKEVQGKTGSMDFQTMSAIAKALHPDRKPSEAEWEALRDKALKLFTAWKADKDKARRR